MPCYHPLRAWRSPKGVAFKPSIDASEIRLPCGSCIGCRLERSRQWALRLVHENRFHSESAFITLTYSDEHIPRDGSLDLKHWQDFMKRLRKHASACGYPKLRFFHAGEYGEKFGRPHYHAILFGYSFREDAVDVEVSDRGDRTWSSPLLSDLWKFGLNRVGEVSFESCAYVARYVTKKITGPSARDHYERIDPHSGEIFQLKPEYCTMSRRPGIGAAHFEKFRPEIFPADECVVRGKLCKPPRFYDRLLEKSDPVMYSHIKDQRECALELASKKDRSERRLEERETVKLAQIGTLKRRYEVG